MEDDYGSNVHVGLEKKVSALERFCYRGFLKNLSGTKFFVVLERYPLQRMSALFTGYVYGRTAIGK